MRRRSTLTRTWSAMLLALAVCALVHPAVSAADLELEGGTAWINAGAPIHGADLRGKIVLLDFWTFCCINCHHVLPDLAYLEEKYKNEIVVIGVHSPKFPAERDTENLRKKVAEYKIKHPVINDANQSLWFHYGVQSWPTLGVFDVDGTLVRAFQGEGNRERLDALIGGMVENAKRAGTLDTRPFVVRPESEKPHTSALNYPGKITADAEGKRLFITDTGNNRIVITDLQGALIDVVGNGQTGFTDGSYEKAAFNRPQGTCLLKGVLYVADTENHAIRAINLREKSVSTIAGTGDQAPFRAHPQRAVAKTQALTSPWDLAPLPEGGLAIAMAGSHQVWSLDATMKEVSIFAGTGKEDVVDGTLATASFAQPSGLATDGKHLYVADSEGSTIRQINLTGVRKVTTPVAGHDFPEVLFNFGDVDGKSGVVKLQHCLGVAIAEGKLFIADSYNNKIKICDPIARTAKTFVGTREAGSTDNPPQFDEPGGLSAAGTTLFIADTNNHAIRALDLKTNAVKTLVLEGVKPPVAPGVAPKFPRAALINVAKTKVAPGDNVELEVSLKIPATLKLNADSPIIYLVESPDSADVLGEGVSPTGSRIDPPSEKLAIKVPLAKATAGGDTLKLKLSMTVFVCKKGAEGFCTFNNYVWNIPIEFAEDAEKTIKLETK